NGSPDDVGARAIAQLGIERAHHRRAFEERCVVEPGGAVSAHFLKLLMTLGFIHPFERPMDVGISSDLPLELVEMPLEALARAPREQVVLDARLAQEHEGEDHEERDVDLDAARSHERHCTTS